MPPGNNNAKPTPRGKCNYCRKESCRGDNCRFSGSEGVCGNSSGSQIRFVNQNSSNIPGYVGRSAYDTGQVSNIGEVVTTSKIPQPGGTLQQSHGTARSSTSISYNEPYPKTTSTLQSETKAQITTVNRTTSSYTTYQRAVPLSHESCVSKPEKVETYRSHLHLWNPSLMHSEQGTHNSETVQPTSSTKVNSNTSVLHNVDLDKTALPMPSIPITEKLMENKKNATTCSLLTSTNTEEEPPKVESDKNGIKNPQNADFKVNDELKPPTSKPSSCASVISKSSGNSDVVDKTNLKRPKSHHSRIALKYEGVVYQILGSRNAKVRVAERNGVPLQKSEWGAADSVHKYALLVVDKIMQDDCESFYPSSTPISSVLNKGDVVVLICTPHNKPSQAFQLFAHEAWRTGRKSQINNDTESVASYCSQTGSETQESTSSKTKRNRPRSKKDKKEVLNGDSYDLSDVVNQWLEKNQYCHNRNETSKTLKLIAGCPCIGKVIEMRLPYAFVVEMSSNDGKQSVFVFSSHFHPQGISSPAVVHGVSLETFVNIGDEIVVIPIKNTSMQEDKFEWVASKAWPKNTQSTTSYNLDCLNKSEQLISPVEKLNQQANTVVKKADQQGGVQPLANLSSLYPFAKNWKEFDGVILSLQYDWGLVKEAVGSQSVYVFTRKNAYLFGLCLQHFILDDVMKEGQLVKFFMENEEIGGINALAVWCGNKLPDIHSFDTAASKYCEERKMKFSTEDLLIQHGKLMYLGQ